MNHYTNTTEFPYDANHGKIRLTDDISTICTFLNLNYDQWLDGFNNLTELYEWIVQCKYYSFKVFEPIINDDKKRATLRSFYTGFINYITEHHAYGDKSSKLHACDALNYFNMSDQVFVKIEKVRLYARRSAKFNGKYLFNKGLRNKDIGKCLKYIERCVIEKYQDYNEWLDNHDAIFIQSECNKWLTIYKSLNFL